MRAVNAATGQVLSRRRRRTTVPQVVTLIAGSKRRSLLIVGDETFYDKKSLLTLRQTQQNSILTARNDKSVAYVTNNERLCSRRFILLKLTTDRHEASRGLSATAELLVLALKSGAFVF